LSKLATKESTTASLDYTEDPLQIVGMGYKAEAIVARISLRMRKFDE
jgi:hypothetical protein